MKNKIQPSLRELLLNGKMMRHIFSSTVFLLTWLKTRSRWKTLITQIGNKYLRLYLLRMQRSARRDGSSFRSLVVTRPSGHSRKMIYWNSWLRSMALRIGLTSLRNLTKSWLISLRIKAVLSGMVSNAVRDGLPLLTPTSTSLNGLLTRILNSLRSGFSMETNGEK